MAALCWAGFTMNSSTFSTALLTLSTSSWILRQSSNRQCELSASESWPHWHHRSIFYRAVFDLLGVPFPKTATVVRTGAIEGYPLGIDSLGYPEIYFRKSLGIGDGLADADWKRLIAQGVRSVVLLGVDDAERQRLEKIGLRVESSIPILDAPGYGPFTVGQAGRWSVRAAEISVCDPVLAAYWIPWLSGTTRSLSFRSIYRKFCLPSSLSVKATVNALSSAVRTATGTFSSYRNTISQFKLLTPTGRLSP